MKEKNNQNQNSVPQSLRELLALKISEKKIDPLKLSEILEVKEEYIQALLKDDFNSLPPDIYVRGALFKLAKFFDLDPDYLWELFKKEKTKKPISEKINNLPFNSQIVRKPGFFKVSFWLIVFFVSLVFVAYQTAPLFVPPRLELSYPAFDVLVNSQTIRVQGKTNAYRLFINNKQASIHKNGIFDYKLSLMPGVNIIEIKARNRLGREVILKRRVVYQVQNVSSTQEEQQ